MSSELPRESPVPHISVVAPVYNEERATLSELVSQLKTTLAAITGDFEIILVDDGSRNDAWSNIVSLAQSDRCIKGIRFTRNFGQHAAIAAGIDHANGDWVVVMDSDLQDRPAVISDLYSRANEGFDVVFVSPANRSESMLYGRATGVFYRFVNFLAGHELEYQRGNFSIIRREVADAYRRVPDRDCFYAGTLGWLGFRHSVVFAYRGERFAGRGTYTFMGLLGLARRVIVNSSPRLLYLAIALGVAMACASFVIAADIVVGKLSKPAAPVPGWASVMSIVLLTAGLTNIMLGLVGLYIAEMFERAKRRPIYVIREQAGRALSKAPHLPAATDSSVCRGGAAAESEDGQDAGMRAT
jgi:glycosyltransferase involved in cell wall biosynthesis